MNKKAFTLIELIVVIAIIWFLGMVWVMTFMQWFSKSRDASRVAALQNMSMALETYLYNHSTYPIPDNAVQITNSWELLTYQGKFGKNVTQALSDIKQAPKDPKDNTYYTYTLSADKKHYQLLAMMEWEQEQVARWLSDDKMYATILWHSSLFSDILLDEVYADDYTDRTPRTEWQDVWTLLDEQTNTPVEDNASNIELSGNIKEYKLVFSTNNVESWLTGKDLAYMMQESIINGSVWYWAPSNCPEWYIAVPGNEELKQPGFCVAKYEMSCNGLDRHDDHNGWTDRNTQSWYYQSWSCDLVSKAGDYPLADITQSEAIQACESIWWHLITNREWMTIARNIEHVASNWSSGIVWSGYIYNWVSWKSWMWCEWTTTDSNWVYYTNWVYTELSKYRATKTGPWGVESCDSKRVLTLSNWEQIWDFAGNVREHVNKADTIDGSDYDKDTNPDILPSNGRWDWTNATTTAYKALYWPSVCYSSWCWVGRVYQSDWTIFLRGGASNRALAGVFTLYLIWTESDSSRSVGFRCVK